MVLSIFLDFKKAFDCVSHDILLSKLNLCGVRGVALEWVRSYLSNRHQYVVINNEKSTLKSITHGVPQGSIIGPLLFLVYINDISKASSFFRYTLFADDSTLSCAFSKDEIPHLIDTVNSELSCVNEWLMANKICLNDSKTKYVVFSYKEEINIPEVRIGPYQIKKSDEFKFLGIYLDRCLSFRYHVNYICQKMSKTVGILHRLKHYLPHSILNTLYQSLFQPYLTYAIEAWFGAFKNVTDKAVVLQTKALRAVNGLSYYALTGD